MDMHVGFSVIYRNGRIMHDRAVRQFNLTGQQMGYLRYINQHPGIPQEELSRQMKFDKGSVAKALRDMADKGYIVREQNMQDRRAYCLFPTEKAAEIAKCGEKQAAEFERNLTKGMTGEEVETFKVLLDKITKNMAEMLERGEDI